jgi:hypothetical protein
MAVFRYTHKENLCMGGQARREGVKQAFSLVQYRFWLEKQKNPGRKKSTVNAR